MARRGEATNDHSGHPGPYVRMQVLDLLSLSVTEAAAAVGITRAALSAFLNARASLSADMALRIEKAFAIPMQRLMHMQCNFDIAHARARAGEINVAPYVPGRYSRAGRDPLRGQGT
ncbi:HigA family addiction module antitoxin [Sinorhizobium meliloti]|nr:HigA family addiction module antitoxin [Sinorhizobium meliloti]MQX73354.1 HigA family addiction module antidote protein [Sinorhizobium meliloti]RVG48970.1 addiction module antidote protein, HigA family [Sinorhizobium meliloti]RVL59362.1 addiction module antidote protein, HigA family [Sinorhizobium meliloti]